MKLFDKTIHKFKNKLIDNELYKKLMNVNEEELARFYAINIVLDKNLKNYLSQYVTFNQVLKDRNLSKDDIAKKFEEYELD